MQLLLILLNKVNNTGLPAQDWFIDQIFGGSTGTNIDISDLETIMEEMGILPGENGQTPTPGKTEFDKVCFSRSNKKN